MLATITHRMSARYLASLGLAVVTRKVPTQGAMRYSTAAGCLQSCVSSLIPSVHSDPEPAIVLTLSRLHRTGATKDTATTNAASRKLLAIPTAHICASLSVLYDLQSGVACGWPPVRWL